MFYGIPYFKYIESNDYVYSIDSVYTAFTLGKEDTEKMFQSLDYLHELFSCINFKCDPDVITHRIVFEANYKCDSYSNLIAHIGIFRVSDDSSAGFLHFNPNRLFQSPKAYDEIKRFLGICSSVTVKKCDVAIDMPFDIVSLTPLKGRKNMMIYIESRKSYTFYWGKRNEEGYAKLYSKSLKNDLDTTVTRLEITLGNPDEGDWEKVLLNSIPPIFMPPYKTGNSKVKLRSHELVIIRLANGFLNGILQRTTLFRILELYEDKARRKIVKDILLAGSQQLQVDFNAIKRIVREVINDIMANRSD